MSDTDSLHRLTAVLSDRYAIERELGRGGMATVYLARDLRHRRPVAVKVLLPELAAVVGGDRFLREIEIAAGLTHPHILPLHDSGQADGLLYYVMPYVDGESLRDRLNRERQLPIEDALRIAAEVADGLGYAHARDVVHRDIKPENILLADGHAHIADFGIARALSAAGGTRLTETGLSLGTPQYMSPEQASGDPHVDGRSDVYALGCVVYEMLVGEAPHTGPSAQAIMAKVLTEPVPQVSQARETVPLQVDQAVGKALARLPADRFGTVTQFAAALAAPASATTAQVSRPTALRAPGTRLPWAIAAAAIVVGAAGLVAAGATARRPPPANLTYRLQMPVEPLAVLNHTSSAAMALSPDGSRLAYVAGDDNAGQLYIRHMGSTTPMAIPGADAAHSPFFSPDGAWIGFVAGGRLKKARVADGVTQTLGDATELHGGSWSPDGWIYLGATGENAWGLSRIREDGGNQEVLLTPDAEHGEVFIVWPEVLPSGGVLYMAAGPDGNPVGLVRYDPESGEKTVVLEGGGNPRYLPSGHVLYGSGPTLYAVPYDDRAGLVTGKPVAIAEDLATRISREPSLAHFAVSANGTVVYLAGEGGAATQVVFVDRNGELRDSVALDERVPLQFGPRISPDGRRLVFWSSGPAGEEVGKVTGDLWMWDRERRGLAKLTREGADFWTLWLPGGRDVVSIHWPEESAELALVRREVDGPGTMQSLVEARPFGQSWIQPYSVSRNGALLLFHTSDQGVNHNIHWLRLGDGSVNTLADSPDDEAQPAISPDGGWIAFVSNASGQHEVYLADFPDQHQRIQLSRRGGIAPAWAPDGRSVYYQTQEDHQAAMVMVRVHTGPALSAEPPETLFLGAFDVFYPIGRQYDVLPGDDGFVLVAAREQSSARDQLTTILNVTGELPR